MTGRRCVLDTADEAARFAAREVLAVGQAVARSRGCCAVSLAGGTTPRRAYAEIAKLHATIPADPAKMRFFFGDERCVPPDDPESNYRMAREALCAIAPLELHRIEAERPDRERAARDYETILPREIDLLILGIGGDGHTASLFPGSPLLDEQGERVAVVEDAPKPPKARITITPPVIAAAREIIVLATGADKAEAVARALEGPLDPKKTPAQLARRGTWILDRAAASLLTNTTRT